MVSDEKERRDFPAYALARVRELAVAQAVIYRSWRVEADVANLEYSLEDVCHCIAALEERSFRHSERPVGDQFWQDVYLARWQARPEFVDDLYIKFMLNRSVITVVLCSFHR